VGRELVEVFHDDFSFQSFHVPAQAQGKVGSLD
jgi:hypothetical protein